MCIRDRLSTCEIPVAAEALEKKPANVMATCIVERNAVESSKSVCTRLAFVLPFAASVWIFDLLTETTAISALAKNAFTVSYTHLRSGNCSD